MSTYSEAWLMNESLNFYMSTNTFNNPVFDARVEPLSTDPVGPGRHQANRAPRASSGAAGRQGMAGRALALKRQCSKFCDNLGFSVRSKLFVLELNLRRKVDLVKGFVGRHLATNKPYHSGAYAAATTNNPDWKAKDLLWSAGADGEALWVPKSRKSLGLQQGKILSRLEAKRRLSYKQQLFNMDLDNNGDQNSLAGMASDIGGGSGHHHSPSCASQSSSSSSSSSASSASSSSSSSAIAPPLLLLSQPSQASKAKSRRGQKGRWCRSRLMADLAKVAPSHLTNSSARKLCIICYSNSPNIVTMPCNHDEICSDCFIELIYMAVKHSQFPLKCVLCRQKIERIRCSRRLLLSVIEKNRNHL